MIFTTLLSAALLGGVVYQRRAALQRKRARFIDGYWFPERLRDKLLERYPHLTGEQIQWVLLGLREYFQLCRLARGAMVAMPSRAVDVAWHEFILYTRQYQAFCTSALGHFLHHTPNDAMPDPQAPSDGIQRAWQLACQRLGLSPQRTERLPWLFTLDADLAIDDGFRYSRQCDAKPGAIGSDSGFCVSHFGCSSAGGCGGDSGSAGGGGGDSGGGDGDGGGCGGGCGGGGGD